MNKQLSNLEGFDSGSNYRFGDKLVVNNQPRSLFDLSHLSTMTIPNAGMLIPITCWETVMNDDFDISVDGLLRVLPQVVPLYSRQRLYIYGFYSRYSDLWNNWQVFMDKGYTGNVQKTIPILSEQLSDPTKLGNFLHLDETHNSVEPNSLYDYLGLPIGATFSNLFGNTSGDPIANISALKSMMFLRIWRDYFMNKNEYLEDRVLLPDDDSRFRLGDDGLLLSAKDENKMFFFTSSNDPSDYDLKLVTVGTNEVYMFGGAYHEYPDDYFTSALPFPQRGTATPLNYSVDTSNLKLDFSNLKGLMDQDEYTPVKLSSKIVGSDTFTTLFGGNDFDDGNPSVVGDALEKGKITGSSIGLQIFTEDIRKMIEEQVELEKLAKTDGSYAQFGLSFFGEISKAAYDYKPLYIGGTYKNIAFTEVLQTATTQTTNSSSETVDNPVGAYAGHGITGITNGYLGHVHCDDYGMIMLIACIMPDIYYSQGLDRLDTDSLQSDKYLPERAKLGFMPILNKELFYDGNNGADEGDDNYLWAYQNAFDHLRYLPNKIHGKIADPSNESFYPYTQARHFTSLPNWGKTFGTATDVRKDYLTAPDEDAYTAQFQINIRAVRPIPYKAQPNTFGF